MKIICVGRNYIDHVNELNNKIPEEPAIFLKPESALITGEQVFIIPDFSREIHHEVELVLKVSRKGKNISEADAIRYINEITTGIDFTARDIQDKLKEKRLSWELSKAFDKAAAIGEFLPLPSVGHPDQIAFRLLINNELRQSGNSKDMIFSFEKIICFISHYFTLEEGDLIFTGTPAGVGPVKSGDVLKAYLNNIQLLQLDIR